MSIEVHVHRVGAAVPSADVLQTEASVRQVVDGGAGGGGEEQVSHLGGQEDFLVTCQHR